MYAQQNCNVRSGPATTYDKVDTLSLNQEVIVIGKVEDPESGRVWYVLQHNNAENEHHMVSQQLLGLDKVKQSTNTGDNSGGNSGTTTPKPSSDCSYDDEGPDTVGVALWGDCLGTDCDELYDCGFADCGAVE